jgi:ferredoxin
LVPEEATLDVTRFVDGDIEKFYPISEGDTKQRKRKPHIVAVINEMCTGCSGSPACVDYCPVAACMFWVPDSEHAPFGRIMVDPLLCIGCKLCTSKGPDGAFLEVDRRFRCLSVRSGATCTREAGTTLAVVLPSARLEVVNLWHCPNNSRRRTRF